MDRLWAPWRMQYIKGAATEERCFLCDVLKEKRDRSNLVLFRGKTAYIILNKFPYNCGHLLVAPKAHKPEIGMLTDAEKLEALALIERSKKALERGMKAQGFNIGANLGRVAGAGVPGHLHFHVVPRWNGDTNFMPVVGETKVLPQALAATYDLLARNL